MKKILPYLWFDQQAETAAEFYTQIFPDSKILSVSRYGDSGSEISGQPSGSVMSLSFELAGTEMVALNGGPLYTFTPANSFFVHCQTAEEVDALWSKLSEGGQVLMELGDYPFSNRYGWLNDRFGVSWQLMRSDTPQKIAPCLLFTGQNSQKAEAAIRAYTDLLPNSQILSLDHQPDGLLLYGSFTLNGQLFTAVASAFEHGFTFSPAISYLLNCETQAEQDLIWDALIDGGEASACGWLDDRFGVTWQVVPGELFDLISNEDPVRSERVLQAMYPMQKLDITVLKRAYAGD